MPNDNSELDQMQAAYKAAVEEWIAAIKEEEALASVNHTVAEVDEWEGAHFKRTKFAIKCRRQRKSTRTRCAKSSLVSERREYMDIDYFMHHEVRNGVP